MMAELVGHQQGDKHGGGKMDAEREGEREGGGVNNKLDKNTNIFEVEREWLPDWEDCVDDVLSNAGFVLVYK